MKKHHVRMAGLATASSVLIFIYWATGHTTAVPYLKPPYVAKGNGKSTPDSVNVCTNRQRLQHLHAKCDISPKHNQSIDPKHLYRRLLVDKTHKLVYCFVAKVGSSTFKELLRDASLAPLAYQVKNLHKQTDMAKLADLHVMHTLPLNTTKEIMSSSEYLKFLIVRHPFDRVWSAYKDKFIGNDINYSRHVAEEIFKEIRHHRMTTIDIQQRARPTWQEFVTYLSRHHQKDTVLSNDVHWNRVVDLCYPCIIQYDNILKLETLNADIRPVLARLSQDLAKNKKTKMMYLNKSPWNASGVRNMFANLTQEVVRNLISRYEQDMKFFGYSYTEKGEMKCEQLDGEGNKCC